MTSLSERAEQGFQRFGVDVTTRTCGECVACCTYVGIAALQKPKGNHCEHECAGGGCAIYEDRPPECAAWYCAWRMGYGEATDRPDLSGVIVTLGNLEHPASVILAGPAKDADLDALRRVFGPAIAKRIEITKDLAAAPGVSFDQETNLRFVLDAPGETMATMRVWLGLLMLPNATLGQFLTAAVEHLKAGGTGDTLMDSPAMAEIPGL